MVEKIKHPKRAMKEYRSSCSYRGEHKHQVKQARWEKRKILG